MAPAFAVRDSVNQMIGMLNTKEWDVKIHIHSQQDFEYLQVYAAYTVIRCNQQLIWLIFIPLK